MKKLKQNIQLLKTIVIPCLLMIVLFSACSKDKDKGPDGGSYPKEVNVEYRVTSVRGVTRGDIFYRNETGGNANLDNVALPFSVKFKRTVKMTENLAVNFSALTGGEVKVEILVDGKVVTTENYSGTSVVNGTAVYIFQ